MPTKSIIIGSNGYLGRHLAFHLQKEEIENANYDLHPKASGGLADCRKFDITRAGDFSGLDPDIDFIFLFAGRTGTANGFEEYRDFIEINEIGLLNLLDWMRKSGSRARVVFPSTRLVYRGLKNHLLREDDPKETRTIYAANKLNAENILWMYHNAFDIDYTVFRICVPYGNLFDEQFSYGTLGFFINKAKMGEDISLFGDGMIRRTFTHVSDISKNIIRAIRTENTRNDIYNIGGENLSLLDVAQLVAAKYGVGISFAPWTDLASKLESDDTVFDDDKLMAALPVQYQYSLKDWLSGIKG
jgi:UDP-glucose 4-epimerase